MNQLSTRMKGIYLTVLLIVCIHEFLGVEKLCFHYTWPGATVTDLNCEDFNANNSFSPCMSCVIYGHIKPDENNVWKNNKTDCTIPMESGSICVKYTYMYNGAVVNISYFAGKVIEDQTKVITTGCYVQYTQGYRIEACACDSNSDSLPCNSTIRNTYSLLIISVIATVSLFMYKIFEIP